MARFLEYAVGAPDVLRSLNFYRDLGFVELTTHDATAYPYAVVTDGRITIGLHGRSAFEPTIRFVRPNVRQDALKLIERGVEFDELHLDQDELHSVTLSSPDRDRIAWLEARTFSPAPLDVEPSALGRFVELTLPVRELYRAARFWAPYARRVLAECGEPKRMRLDAGGLPLGVAELHLPSPMLTFVVDDDEAMCNRLDGLGLVPVESASHGRHCRVLHGPEGTTLAIHREDFMHA